ncbi:MAG: histidine phosphatase family protein [Candidatus Taylorbacteria bacterium]|nr:histidine phosphatase family protein [Candidatus Taylorbacteria bacterium]
MKKVYFVRHGITESNENNKFQFPDTPLSEKGLKQAEFLAKRFESIHVDVIISSPMARAKKTAEIIGKHTGHEIIEDDLFMEVKRPTILMGKNREDAEIQAIRKEIKNRYTETSWRHSDEENFILANERAMNALKFILDRPEQDILIVTHGEILRLMLAAMTFGNTLTAEIAQKVSHIFATFNTGITKVEYNDKGWYVLVWNDHAHLG